MLALAHLRARNLSRPSRGRVAIAERPAYKFNGSHLQMKLRPVLTIMHVHIKRARLVMISDYFMIALQTLMRVEEAGLRKTRARIMFPCMVANPAAFTGKVAVAIDPIAMHVGEAGRLVH